MVRLLAFILCRIFFKHIHISGTPYCNGSTIWAANHSSAVVDPAVLLGLGPVPVRPLAKTTLLQNPVMRVFMWLTRSILVSRLQDIKIDVLAQKQMFDKGDFDPNWRTKINNKAFEQVAEALLNHENILIFPEGVSHDHPYLYPFKTGLARMALQAMSKAQNPQFSVIVQPVVIDYSEKDEFRSELNIHYCEPVAITSTDYSIQDIMLGVRRSMEDGFASFFNWDEKRNWRFIFEISFGRCPLSSREFRIFVEKYRIDFESDPILLGRIQTMRRMLQVVNISAVQLAWGRYNYKRRNFIFIISAYGVFYLLITLPVEILGAIVWIFPAKVCEILGKRSTLDRDLRATMKLVHGMWFFPLWAFILSSLFTFVGYDYVPHMNWILLWLIFLILTPVFFAVSLVTTESADKVLGILKLVKLRFFFPRGWRELVREWKSITDGVLSKIKEIS